jgi:hypothetical protein
MMRVAGRGALRRNFAAAFAKTLSGRSCFAQELRGCLRQDIVGEVGRQHLNPLADMAGHTGDIGLAHQDDDLWRPGRGDNAGNGHDESPELHIGQRVGDKDEIEDGELLNGFEGGLSRLLAVDVHRVLLENGQCLLQGLGVGTDDEDLLLDKPDGFSNRPRIGIVRQIGPPDQVGRATVGRLPSAFIFAERRQSINEEAHRPGP